MGEGQLVSLDLLAAEFGNVLWKKVRRGELAIAEAIEIADAFVLDCPVTLRSAVPLLHAAVEIADRWQQTVYDSLYVATALAEGCSLVTADERLVEALKNTKLAHVVRSLSETRTGA